MATRMPSSGRSIRVRISPSLLGTLGIASDGPSWTGGVARSAGVVDQVVRAFLIYHPVCADQGSFAASFLIAQPPLLSRRGDRSPLRAIALVPRIPFR